MVGASRPPLGVCASPHLSSLSLLVKKRESLLVTKTKLWFLHTPGISFYIHGKEGVLLAVAHPWAFASSYLSSQSLADSRSNLHMPPRRSSHP